MLAEPKRRILIRFQPLIADCLEYQAAYLGIKVGTITNELIRDELKKIEAVGIKNCFVQDSEEYETVLSEIRKGREAYILPSKDRIQRYLPDKNGRTLNRQISIFLTENEAELLDQIVRLQDIMGTMKYGEISSYRYAVHGLLLNSPVIKRQL